MQYTENVLVVKMKINSNIILNFAQSMFWSKNKKNGIPLHTPVLLNKSGVERGIHYTVMFCNVFRYK